MELLVMKSPSGALIPMREEDREAIGKWKTGQGVRVTAAKMRNARFFRKWWLLAELAFDIWCETTPKLIYRGVEVLPEFGRFRKDLTIMAGFCRPVWDINGEMTLEAESLNWRSMNEERFEKLYSATVTVVLEKIIPRGRYTEDELRETVDRLMEFA